MTSNFSNVDLPMWLLPALLSLPDVLVVAKS
jgi:hypothetical protein